MKKKLIAATVAALMGTGSASAAIVTFSTPISVPNNLSGVYVNFLTGVSGITPASVPGWDFNAWGSSNTLAFFFPASPTASFGGVASTTTGPYLSLAPGAVVSSASTFSAVTATTATTAFQTTGTHILGFRFFNETTNAINYGYLTMTNTAPNGFPTTITGWSFENTGAAITVPGGNNPAVPEPATWAMMMLGFGAMGAALRRRTQVRVRYA